ncbi:MAG TPA: ABC transporter permease [Bryobacteraceae bacterium]|jgi:putative ABC transport system permease protein|nr:ABC transporter permease [Bryobacteraceae bacterium]
MWGRRREERERDFEREMSSHLEAEAAEQQERGVPAEDARYAARRQFGNPTLMKEEVRQMWGWGPAERLLQDVRFSLRTLRKSPGFTIFAVLALALGLGANAAIFSVVDAVLLRSLPFRSASRLVEIWEDASHMGFPLAPLAPANFVDWKQRNHVFVDMAALKGDLYALTRAGRPEQLEGSPVTANLFPLLGVSPVLGRNFSAEEDRPGGPRVVLISYGLWQRRFGGDSGIIGRDIWLNDEKYSVIGVMPRGITFPEKSEIWAPLALGPRDLAQRDNHYLRVFARLKPGVTLGVARREMTGLAAQLAREYPETNTNIGAVVVSLHDQLVGDLKPTLWAVMAGVACVLLIACANLAGLLLTRGLGREREFAVRAALGAGRARLIRQTLTESLLLAGLGGAAGILIAVFTTPFLRQLVPDTLSAWSEPRIDLPLLGFLLLLSTLAAVLFGTLPALLFSRPGLSVSLQRGGRVAGTGSTRIRKLLIVSEVALAVVLLIGAGLLTKTLWTLAHVPLGFNPEGVMTLRTSLPVSSSSPYNTFQARVDFYRRVLESVRAIPGVASAGYTTFLPLTNSGGTSPFVVEGAPPPPPGQSNDANHRVISSDYFRTMGIRLRAGRFFRNSDTAKAPPVAMINEAMARQYWPGQNPLGHRFQLAGVSGVWFTIVGVVDDIRQTGLDVNGRPEMYFPYTQAPGAQGYTTPRDLAVRVEGDPVAYARALEAAVWRVDRNQPIADVMPMKELIRDKLISREVALKLIAAFAGLALLLAALGLYGLLAYTVLQRRGEIGVRMALGAEPRQVSAAVLREGLQLVLAGVAIGAAGSWAAMRSLQSLLYGVAPTDAWVLAGSAFVLVAIGLIASYLPAHRAAAIDPATALRYE